MDFVSKKTIFQFKKSLIAIIITKLEFKNIIFSLYE